MAAVSKLKHPWYVQAYQRTVESSNLQEKVSGVIRLKVRASSTDVLASARLSTCILSLNMCGPQLACFAQQWRCWCQKVLQQWLAQCAKSGSNLLAQPCMTYVSGRNFPRVMAPTLL